MFVLHATKLLGKGAALPTMFPFSLTRCSTSPSKDTGRWTRDFVFGFCNGRAMAGYVHTCRGKARYTRGLFGNCALSFDSRFGFNYIEGEKSLMKVEVTSLKVKGE